MGITDDICVMWELDLINVPDSKKIFYIFVLNILRHAN